MRKFISLARAYSVRSLFTASIVLAITFVFSCSSNDGDDGSSSSSSSDGSSSSVVRSSSSIAKSSSSVIFVVSSSSVQSSVVYGPSVIYEGETYKTVVIGNQTWFQRNLNYAVDGSVCYDNMESNCDIYGRLYYWATAMDLSTTCNSSTCASQVQTKHKGICPDGWHIPSKGDWDALATYIESDKSCSSCDAKHLKTTSGWNLVANCNGLDSYGFSALPGGSVNSNGYLGGAGVWWSASEYLSDYAYYSSMLCGYENVIRGSNDKNYYLFSVRCLQD